MLNKVFKEITAVSIFLLFFASGLSIAEGENTRARSERIESLVRELGLTSEQRDRIDGIRKVSRETRGLINDKIKSARAGLRVELEKFHTDTDALEKVMNDLVSAQAEMVDERVRSFLEIKEVMTEEQFNRMVEKKDVWRKERKRGRTRR